MVGLNLHACASPIVLVKKKTGEFRLCMDYRKLNAVTHKERFPLPRIQDILDTVGKCCYFSTLDLASGYYQVAMDPASQEKTAFTTFSGLYEFRVLSFGLTNGPSTFQRLMEHVLHGLLWRRCFVYLDDILIASPTFEEHVATLKVVFARLRDAGLTLKPKKCKFLQSSVTYLGHTISNAGVFPDQDKIAVLEHYPVP